MKDFSGKLAIITGGGTGMGRALARQLAEDGCSVAMCDINEDSLAESQALAMAGAAQGVKVTTHIADVAIRQQIEAFRDDVLAEHDTDHVHLVISNAGIGGGGSFLTAPEAHWERTFNVCWYGVYYMARAFMPLLVKANEGHIVNVSSVNGFWASLGPGRAHTAYCTAKFAVKGFTEALMEDLSMHAPHVRASVVMPGHIGTDIALNSFKEFAGDVAELGMSPDALDEAIAGAQAFRDNGLDPEVAAKVILDGVRADRWRILIGDDAVALDKAVRAEPEAAYQAKFWEDKVNPVMPGLG